MQRPRHLRRFVHRSRFDRHRCLLNFILGCSRAQLESFLSPLAHRAEQRRTLTASTNKEVNRMSKLHRIATRALLIVVPVLYVVLETAGIGHP